MVLVDFFFDMRPAGVVRWLGRLTFVAHGLGSTHGSRGRICDWEFGVTLSLTLSDFSIFILFSSAQSDRQGQEADDPEGKV